MITYKVIPYLCFFIAMAILLMAAAGFFVGDPNALFYKVLFVVFLSISVCMYYGVSRKE